jgi:hypothetical protein
VLHLRGQGADRFARLSCFVQQLRAQPILVTAYLSGHQRRRELTCVGESQGEPVPVLPVALAGILAGDLAEDQEALDELLRENPCDTGPGG